MIYLNLKKIILLIIILINIENFNKNGQKPKISIFLPIFNMENYIEKTLLLLQNQTLKNIEIIAVNDYSTDKTYEILRKFTLKDKRIKIINNTKNHGVLYSRAMGIIHSKGKYIINLDPDDQYNNYDDLEYLYKKAVKSKVDIVSFSYLFKSTMKIKNICDEFDKKIKQPKLFESIYKYSNHSKDTIIWNKLIKREIFLKAFKLLEDFIYNGKWNYHEDNIWSFLVHKVAKSKICTKKLIYIYNNNNNNSNSIMRTRGGLIEFINIIYLFELKRKVLQENIYFQYLNDECDSLINFIKRSKLFRFYIKNNNYLKNKTIYNSQICSKYYNISKSNKIFISNLSNIF